MNSNQFKKIADRLLSSIAPRSKFKYPKVIDSILTCFSAFGQEGGIVGGAVRDYTLGKEIRDFDVYIQSTYKDIKSDEAELAIHTKRYGYIMYNVTSHEAYEGGDIIAVYKLIPETGAEVDIIFGLSNIQEHVDNFTCSISKIWFYIFDGLPVFNDDFIKTVRSKICKIYDNRGSHPATIEIYVEKISKKYPEYTFEEG